MGLGDVSQKNYPKMTLIAAPQNGGALSTRSFIPHVCHDAIGVLAAVTVGTACVLEGSVCDGIAFRSNTPRASSVWLCKQSLHLIYRVDKTSHRLPC
jgi:2-methylaconitate cis-trans-isomerase PrpF